MAALPTRKWYCDLKEEMTRFRKIGGNEKKVRAALMKLCEGLQHETKVRYPGVQMAHVSVKEAFVGPLREAYRRARIAATIALSIPEKITLLKTWILPTLLRVGNALR